MTSKRNKAKRIQPLVSRLCHINNMEIMRISNRSSDSDWLWQQWL